MNLKQQPAKAVGRVMPAVATAVIAGAAAIRIFAAPISDDIAPEEVARRQEALRIEQPLKLLPVAATTDAVDTLALPPDQRSALEAALADSRVHLAWIALFDSDAVDGDRVAVESLGLTHRLTLGREPVSIPVAVPNDGLIRLTGVDQGLGGGVTVGVMSGGRPVKLPPLAVGQTINLRVAVP